MLNVHSEGIVLERSTEGFDNQAVLNPACLERDGITHMFYRGVRQGDVRSSIGYCQLDGRTVVRRSAEPVLFPEHDYERMGTEDPRVVFLDGCYYLFYTAYDGKNALFAYATSPDLVHFVKRGVISPRLTYREAGALFGQSTTKVGEKYFMFESYIRDRQGDDILLWEKDAFIFPRKFKNRFALIHRVLPGIQVAYFEEFSHLTDEYWREHLRTLGDHVVLDPKYRFENRNVGGGCPPIETEEGWLLIYHAVEDVRHARMYHAAAALLALDDPTRVIGRMKRPLFSPTERWERYGDVNNVVFPTGAVVRDGRLYIYYGAADTLIAAKSVDMKELLAELKTSGGA